MPINVLERVYGEHTERDASIRMKPEIKRRLAKLAATSGRSSNFLISDAVESYVADQERMLAALHQARRYEGLAALLGHEP